jgi:hypothetical protein
MRALVTAAALVSGGFATSWAASISWDGGASPNNNWYDAANWSGDVVPGAGDDVLIDLSVQVNVDSSSPALVFQSLVLGESNNPTLRISTGIQSGYLEVRSGATLMQATNVELVLTSAAVLSGGTIIHNNCTVSCDSKVNIVTTGDFTLASGGTIDVDGDGYSGGGAAAAGSGTQPGGGGPGGGSGGGGGGHGGAGGAGGNSGGAAGGTDDSVTVPALHGSGGGGGNGGGAGVGGAGGGLVLLTVAGTLTLDGTVTADGVNGTGDSSGAGGGGAGGAIYIQAGNMAGGGSVSVDGGDGGTTAGTGGGGGGGGGRVALVWTGTNVSTITYSADAGALGANNGAAGSFGTAFDQPGKIADLTVTAIVATGIGASSQTVRLQWTSPKVGIAGASNNWDIRYASYPVATQTDYNALAPNVISTSVVEGVVVSTDIGPLDPSVTWYFAITASDLQNLRSVLSPGATALSYIATSTGSAGFSYGIAWGDADNDGDLDLWIANSNGQNDRLMQNLGNGAFHEIVILQSNLNSRGIALADFDQDGDLDAAVAATTGVDDYLLWNNFIPTGQLTFSTRAIIVGSEGFARGVAAADVDNDGDIDIGISRTNDEDEYIAYNQLRETGSFSFTTAAVADTNEYSRGAAFADYDRDGNIDFAWSNTVGGTHNDEVIAINDGFGKFSTFTITGVGGESRGIAWADYDDDGDYDLLVANKNADEASILRNDGAFSFTEVVLTGTAGEGWGAAWADFDNDGDLDAALARHEGEEELIVVGDGVGGFSVARVFASSGASQSVSWGDADGDGDLDLAVAQDNGDDEFVLRNDANPSNNTPAAPSAGFAASFEEYHVGATSGTMSFYWTGVTTDETAANNLKYFVRVGTAGAGTQGVRRIPPAFSLDGYSGGGSEIYSTWLGASQRGIKTILSVETTAHWAVVTEDSQLVRSSESTEQETRLVAPNPVTTLSAATVSTGFGASSTTVVLTWTAPGDDAGEFAIVGGTFDIRGAPTPIASIADYIAAPLQIVIATSVSPGVYASTDIGPLDPSVTWYFALTTKDGLGIRSALSNPATAEAAVRVFRITDRSNGVAWGDFDNDGDMDYVVANNDADERLYTNDGAGNFTESSIDATADGRGIALADYDVDGDLDILVARYATAADNILRNDGGGSFTPVAAQTETSTKSFAAAWADYDNDGDLDFAVTTDTGEDAYLATNDGDGTFSTSTLTGVSGLCTALAWGDYNADSFLDLAVGCDGVDDYLLTNVSGSTFTYSLLTAGGALNTGGLAWVDVDADGDLDLAAASAGSGYYLRNDAGSFSTKVTITGAVADEGIAAADFDNDGDVDLAFGGTPIDMAYNDGAGVFSVVSISSTASSGNQGIAAGDMDGDGDLDLAATRWDAGEDILVRNDVAAVNTAPATPTGLSASFSAFSNFATSGTLTLQWNDATDTESDSDLLDYFVRVGTTVAGSSTTLKFPSAFSSDGYGGHGYLYSTRISASQRGVKLFLNTETTVYWSVLAIDPSGARSAPASEDSIDLSAPAAISDLGVSQDPSLETSSSAFVTLVFTAPGENGAAGDLGASAQYDIRWTTAGAIDSQSKYVAATNQKAISAQGTAGGAFTVALSVDPGETYHFAITTIDSAGVRSGLSNSASFTVDAMRELTTDVASSEFLQGQTTAFLKIALWTDTGQTRWTKIRVKKDGQLPDAAITNVGIYRDANVNGVFDGADEAALITAAEVFSSSAAELSLTSIQTIGLSTKTYFLAATISDSYLPVAGTSTSLVLDGEAFTVSSGGVMGIDFPALQFDGSDDKLTAAYDSALDVGPGAQGTVEAWIKTEDTGANLSIVTRGDLAGNAGYRLWLNGGGCGAGVPTFYAGSSALCANDGVGNVSIADGEWHHVAGVYNTGTGRIYIDGEELGSGAMGGILGDTSSGLAIGGSNETGAAGYFTGEIDDVRISNFARYPSELPPLRRSGTSGAAAVYHFDTVASGTNTFADATSNAISLAAHGQGFAYGRSTATHILDSQDVVFASGTDISPALFFRNTSAVGVLKLEFWTDGDFATLSSMSVHSTGTGSESGVTNLQLFLDDGDGSFDSGLDAALVSGVDFVSGTAAFALSGANVQLLSPATKAFFIAWDVGGSAENNQSLGISVSATTQFLLTGDTDTVSTAFLPIRTTPVNVVAAEPQIAVESATNAWINTSSVVFQGVFNAGNVASYRYVFDQNPGTVVVLGDNQWTSGNTTVTATTDANDWYFHVRAVDSVPALGLQEDIGPYFIDTTDPTGSTFRHFDEAGSQLQESQFNDLAVSVTAQLQVSDALAGLSLDGPAPLAPSSGTVSLWHFDETSGSWADAGPAQNFLGTAAGSPARVAGRFGAGVQTVPGAYLNNPAPLDLPVNNEERTIEAWILPRSTQGTQGIVQWGSGGGVMTLQLASGVLEADLGGTTASAGPVLSTGVWQHVAFTFDGNTGRFFLNGTERGTNAYGAQTTTTGALEVGRGASGGFDGTVDELRISKRVIGADELFADYERGDPYFVSYSTDAGRSWRVVSSTEPGSGAYVTLSGGHGASGPETLKAIGLDFIVSTLTATGAEGTNQIRFHPNDLAGNAATLGPFTVLVDTNAPVAYSTPSLPANGEYTGIEPDFYWTGPSTPLVQGLGGEFFIEVSSDDPSFAVPSRVIEVAVGASVTDANAEKVTGVYNSSFTLTEGATYYWRVRSRSSLGVFGEFGPVHSFVTDAASPTASGFIVYNGTGGVFGETDFIGLLSGVTAQITVQDAVAGISRNQGIEPPSSAIGFWRFSETGGAAQTDHSGSGNTGTLTCDPGPCSPATLRATPRGAGVLCASGRGMTAANADFNFSASSDFTVEAWVNPTTTSGNRVIAAVGAKTDGTNTNWVFAVNNSALNITNATLGGYLGPALAVSNGVWQHVAVSVRGGDVSFFVNGELNSQGTWGGNSGGGTMPFSVCSGVRDSGGWESPFLGMVDEVLVSSRASTAAEVAARFAASRRGRFSVEYSTTAGQSWNVVSATEAAGGKPWIAISGTDGDTAARTFTVRDLTLTQSTNTASGAGATNQLVFVTSDRGNNVTTAGPFAVVVDTSAEVAVSTPVYPANGTYVRGAPNFLWSGPSTATAAQMGPNAFFLLEADDNADFTSPEVLISTPIRLASTSTFATEGTYLSTQTLSDGATYFWRVRAAGALGILSQPLTVYSFVTDASSPVASNFVSITSTGGAAIESIGIDLLSGVTAQMSLQDAGAAGIATIPVSGVLPYGVLLSTDGGAFFDDGVFGPSYDNGSLDSFNAIAGYAGRLYAGGGPGAFIYVYDGASWTQSADLSGTEVVSLLEFDGQLYAGQAGSGEIHARTRSPNTTAVSTREPTVKFGSTIRTRVGRFRSIRPTRIFSR